MTHEEPGTNQEPGPAERLAELLETVSPEVRSQITAWLLRTREPAAVGGPWPPLPQTLSQLARAGVVPELSAALPANVDSQVVTIRLPAPRHAALRDWCNEHGFSMAAVVRGLVERFLEEQGGLAAA